MIVTKYSSVFSLHEKTTILPRQCVHLCVATAIKLVRKAGSCEFTMARVCESGQRLGALWHIYGPQDANKTRELLNKVDKERGKEVSLENDLIHGQSFYPGSRATCLAVE